MGKIVVTEFISLDGIVEDRGGAEPGSPADWTAGFDTGTEGDQLKLAELNAADAQLLGRVPTTASPRRSTRCRSTSSPRRCTTLRTLPAEIRRAVVVGQERQRYVPRGCGCRRSSRTTRGGCHTDGHGENGRDKTAARPAHHGSAFLDHEWLATGSGPILNVLPGRAIWTAPVNARAAWSRRASSHSVSADGRCVSTRVFLSLIHI